jgi:hypothetical protein
MRNSFAEALRTILIKSYRTFWDVQTRKDTSWRPVLFDWGAQAASSCQPVVSGSLPDTSLPNERERKSVRNTAGFSASCRKEQAGSPFDYCSGQALCFPEPIIVPLARGLTRTLVDKSGEELHDYEFDFAFGEQAVLRA